MDPSQFKGKKKHKSQVILDEKREVKINAKKRTSCMTAKEYAHMEESPIQNVKQIFNKVLSDMFLQLEEASCIKVACTEQLEQTTELLHKFEFFTSSPDEASEPVVKLEGQPQNQPKHQVIKKSAKEQLSSSKGILDRQVSRSAHYNKSGGLNSKNKFLSKDKLSKLTSIYPSASSANSALSSKSIKSITSSTKHLSQAHANPSRSYHLSGGRIEEQSETEVEKQRREKQEIIKKLMREHNSQLKQVRYCCPEPIMQKFRQSFLEPEPRETSDLRTSFLHLRALRQVQEKANKKHLKKRSIRVSSKQNTAPAISGSAVKLPSIHKEGASKKLGIFAQDENGEPIKIKSNLNRELAQSAHEDLLNKRPCLKDFSSIANLHFQKELLKNEKLFNQKMSNEKAQDSILTTANSSGTFQPEEHQIEQKIDERFRNKAGVKINKSIKTQRISLSTLAFDRLNKSTLSESVEP